jgi:GntR family transcriptional regulator
MEIVRQGRSGSDQKPVEVTEYIVASDRIETVMVLERDDNAIDPWPVGEEDLS